MQRSQAVNIHQTNNHISTTGARAMNRSVKASYVHDILKNDTYMPDSGLYQRLFKALLEIPGDDLCNLSLIVAIKTGDDFKTHKDIKQQVSPTFSDSTNRR
jgi:hypothetical protein